jgi:glycosyltransferase involved in cell wall biosynthesis
MPLDIPKENLILSVGYLEKRKGHDFVILAIANIPREIRPRLGIVYLSSSEDDVRAREYKKYLERLADDNRVEVSFFPDVSDDELVLLYNKAKLTTCAFIREPFGFIPLESMACQVPVVAINEGGLRESIIHNQTGILTKRDMVEFVKAMEYLLKNEETRIRMGKSGRQHVLNNWSWERATEELENNFLSLLRTQ